MLDPEAAFVCWYHNGQRRSYRQVAQLFEVSYSTVLRTASDHDWIGRADHLDREAQAIVDRQVVGLTAHATRRIAEIAITEVLSFARRLQDDVRASSGIVLSNPARLRPDELSVADLLRTAKVLEMAGMIGGQSDPSGPDEQPYRLDDLRREVAEMYLLDEELKTKEDRGLAPQLTSE